MTAFDLEFGPGPSVPLPALTSNESDGPIVFETLRNFLKRPLPKAESLVGTVRGGTNLLPRYGWVMPWGREGSAKTSVLVDLLFHAAAGLPWLHYPVARELRVVVIINEGVPGGLQDKLDEKRGMWQGDTDKVLDNLAMYVSPWGEFSIKDSRMADHARAYALDFEADYVALDPLHTMGTTGGGLPQETEAFKHLLREFGLWQDLGVITAHHSNKNGMVSGDWARHPDTVIHLEKDGKNPATKLTLQKARPADPDELGVPQLLEWVRETMGYRRVQIEQRTSLSDEELRTRITDALATADEPLSMSALQEIVTGEDKRVSALVKADLTVGRIVNKSTHKGRFRLTLPLPGENTDAEYADKPKEEEQTRMDTEVLLGAPSPPTRKAEQDPPMVGVYSASSLPPCKGGGEEAQSTTTAADRDHPVLALSIAEGEPEPFQHSDEENE